MREILTLQFGHYANFVGTHFWNFQDEIFGLASTSDYWKGLAPYLNSDAMYHTTYDSAGRETYHPSPKYIQNDDFIVNETRRLVLFDLAGSLGSWGAQAAAPEATGAGVATWRGQTAVHKSGQVVRHDFQQALSDMAEEGGASDAGGAAAAAGYNSAEDFRRAFEADVDQYLPPPPQEPDEPQPPPPGPTEVRLLKAAAGLDRTARYFTDFSKTDLHKKSMMQLPGIWEGVHSFSGYGEGLEAASRPDFLEDASDRVRHFTEACDALQGVVALVDRGSGFGGLAGGVLPEIMEEYPKSPLLLFSLRAPRDPATVRDFSAAKGSYMAAGETADYRAVSDSRIQALNDALEVAQLTQCASLYVPLECPWNSGTAGGMRYDPRSVYQTSAVLACMIDTATLPARASSYNSSQYGASIGCDLDLGSLAYAARGDGAAGNIAHLSGRAPGPELWEGEGGEAGDGRSRQGAPARAGPSGRPPGLHDLSTICFLPGFSSDTSDAVSESIVLRGCRLRSANPKEKPSICRTARLHDMAAETLFPLPPRCPKMISVCPTPLAVPVTYPPRTFEGHGREGFRVPPELGSMTRLAASRSFRPWLRSRRAQLKVIASSGEGRTLISSWGLGSEGVGAALERYEELEEAMADADDADDVEF